jgi:hypothetical protein
MRRQSGRHTQFRAQKTSDTRYQSQTDGHTKKKMTPDETLMAEIRTRYAAVIQAACDSSDIPPAFLAALIANESGGYATATRFEPSVLLALWEVLLGRKAAFGEIGATEIYGFLMADPPIFTFSLILKRLDSLATSYGLTQIMGYNVLGQRDPVQLAVPSFNLTTAIRMLHGFMKEFGLIAHTPVLCEQLFRCWNTGRPDGKTADPDYVANGQARIAAYLRGAAPPAAISA